MRMRIVSEVVRIAHSVEQAAESAVVAFTEHRVNGSTTAAGNATEHVASHANVSFVGDAVLEPIATYGLIIGLVVFCLCLPFIGWYCRSCGLRSIPCIRRCFRTIGVDNFDDFEVSFVVHEATASSSSGKHNFRVRISAGRHHVQTECRSTKVFQENLLLPVEQGVREVRVELIDGSAWRRSVLAVLVLDPYKDIFLSKGVSDKVFSMRSKQGVSSPQVKLTFCLQKSSDEESGILAGSSSSCAERNLDFLVSEQLRKVGWKEKVRDPVQQLNFLANACCGPLERFGLVGEKQSCWLGIKGPPKQRGFKIGIWKDEAGFHSGKDAWLEVDVVRIAGIKPDPGRPEVFFIYYIDEKRVRQNVVLRRVDRTREVWVRMLTMFISDVRALMQQAKATKAEEQHKFELLAKEASVKR